jgi:hypothetical protein
MAQDRQNLRNLLRKFCRFSAITSLSFTAVNQHRWSGSSTVSRRGKAFKLGLVGRKNDSAN